MNKNKGLTPEKKEQLKELIGICQSPISLSLLCMEERYKMSKPLIEFIICESGDWEILRMNLGEDFNHGFHSIPNGSWICLLEVLGYEVEIKCISDEDMEMGNY